MNKVAVALAADSAATSQQGGKQKIYNSADKLFQLDGFSPVGIMVYGSAEYMGIPWETVIKLYRRFHHGPHDHLHAYGEDFLKFLASPELVTDEFIEDYFLQTTRQSLWGLHAKIAERLKASILTLASTTFAEASDHFCDEVLANIAGATRVENSPADILSQLLVRYEALLEREISNIFGADDPGVSGRTKLKEIVCAITLVQPTKNDSGIAGLVVAGFGKAELFPDIWNCHIKGLAPTRLLQFSRQPWKPVSIHNNASITPFAQDEMVHSFMTGIDPNLRQTMLQSFDILLQNLVARLATLLPTLSAPEIDAFKAQGDTARNDLLQNLRQGLTDYSRDNHINPVVAAVAVLPKDELAVMAETLVALTSFKRRMSSAAETVGGAIDVAVISKGDGFIWIKRKHYFRPELNVRYIERITHHAHP